jgi:hypothetical protein
MSTFKIKVKVIESCACPECGHVHDQGVWKYLTTSEGSQVIFANEEGAKRYIDTYSSYRGSDESNFKIIKE